MSKTKQFGLVAHVCKVEPKVALFRAGFLRDATDREEEAWLSSILIFELHIWVSVRANQCFEAIVNLIIIFVGFSDLLYWLLFSKIFLKDKLFELIL